MMSVLFSIVTPSSLMMVISLHLITSGYSEMCFCNIYIGQVLAPVSKDLILV